MWVQAGQSADTFWDQTPATFQSCMAGVRARLESEAQARTALAYETGAFAALAQGGKLKPLSHYTGKDKVQSPRQMASAIQAMGTKSNMKVKRVARTES